MSARTENAKPLLLSIIPAAPGWRVALLVEGDDDHGSLLDEEPCVAFGLFEYPKEPRSPLAGDRFVSALIATEHGMIEPAHDLSNRQALVGPGKRAVLDGEGGIDVLVEDTRTEKERAAFREHMRGLAKQARERAAEKRRCARTQGPALGVPDDARVTLPCEKKRTGDSM